MDEYPGSCGRCFELKCRPAEINAADGSVKNLNQTDSCFDQDKSIIIQIVDTCPCSDNKAWCCGDTPHFDLGQHTFKKVSEKLRLFLKRDNLEVCVVVYSLIPRTRPTCFPIFLYFVACKQYRRCYWSVLASCALLC